MFFFIRVENLNEELKFNFKDEKLLKEFLLCYFWWLQVLESMEYISWISHYWFEKSSSRPKFSVWPFRPDHMQLLHRLCLAGLTGKVALSALDLVHSLCLRVFWKELPIRTQVPQASHSHIYIWLERSSLAVRQCLPSALNVIFSPAHCTNWPPWHLRVPHSSLCFTFYLVVYLEQYSF